jgi:hypothetical protein
VLLSGELGERMEMIAAISVAIVTAVVWQFLPESHSAIVGVLMWLILLLAIEQSLLRERMK